MPSRAITVTLNHDHSRKFVFLSPNPISGYRDDILREARNKFRLKALSSVFLRGGALLDDTVDISTHKEVWVGKGEPYSGSPLDPSRSTHPGTVHIIQGKSFIDDTAIKQLEYVSGLAGVHLAIGMPDLHPGNRFPIGCAIASEGVYPALIGSDVGCGIALYHLPASARSTSSAAKLANMLRGLDEPWSGSVADWLAHYDIHRSSIYDAPGLGTVGAGNHFAEICTVEKIVDDAVAAELGIKSDGLYLLVHTGSRGLGASILASHTKTEANPYIPPDSNQLADYLVEHDYAIKWAIANRDLIAYRIQQCIYQTLNDSKSSLQSPRNLEKIVDVTHNSVTLHPLTIGDETKNLWVHRKGAAPADKGVTPCPGSRGDFSWLLQPTGTGNINALSLAHGAGRRYGRNALHTGEKIHKASLTTTSLGSEVICTDADLLLEERPEAYKDIACVVEDMEDQGICKGVVILRPFVTYKVREAREGRR
ncbi:release factor H-coupled R [Infundibulicybe gibba]|nr:release factor H-coupled R [Infundibulicybe gibba]